MTPLENPPENPCFGCGPEHARGLRLAFARDGASVVCTYTPKPDEIGWPGLFHTGLHYTTLFEACYWAALELTGQVHVASGAQTFDQQRLPRVGAPFTTVARIVAKDPLRLVAESVSAEGKPLARLEVGMKLASRVGAERAGIVLPAYLTEQMAP
ncbi:MAG TPA: hypothetical protein VM370_02060 [Candidatus Thermoplasmatota archaeon]|nr:hypothetical protein [Candidatus Thermoplasmatota archaeon]